jgi:pimeloyl-ACP methyl ester carboxylesterase
LFAGLDEAFASGVPDGWDTTPGWRYRSPLGEAVVAGSGHCPWAENPEEFNRAFFGFLEMHFRNAP